MKTLIAYCSRHGSAQKIAHLMSQELDHTSVRLLDLKVENIPVNVDDYEQVVIGGSIHYGKIQHEVRKFCEDHFSALLKKRLGLYMCYMLEDKVKEEFNDAFLPELRNHACALGFFGGELQLEKMGLIDSFVTKNIFHKYESESKLDEEAFDSFVAKMNFCEE
jgi:menaquinone-dependent protoporphyrinogen oxidase